MRMAGVPYAVATYPIPPHPPAPVAEAKEEFDSIAAIAEKWGYWSDGVGELLPFCPECARREFADEASTSQQELLGALGR